MKLGFAILFVSFVVGGCDNSHQQSSPVEEQAPPASTSASNGDALAGVQDKNASQTVVMLGDSLMAGFALAPGDALPKKIETRLMEEGMSVSVVNAGVSGDTSAGGLARYDWSVAAANPDLLVLALGANDYLNGVDPQQTRANLAAIIERALASKIEVLLVSLSARSYALDDPSAADFAAIYPELAETYSTGLYQGLLDDIRARPDLLMPDGLHPTAEGVEIIAAPLAKTIGAVISADANERSKPPFHQD